LVYMCFILRGLVGISSYVYVPLYILKKLF
jgi:hypothetical protein